MRSKISPFMLAAAVAALVVTATRGSAQARQAGHKTARLAWGSAPDVFPAGARMAVESGDPTKSGEFIVRLSFPAGYRIPPHFHPTAEHVRVRTGALLVGMGDVLNETKVMKLAPGDTGTIPATQHHFAFTRVPTVISIRAEGPFAMTYVNPADDPRKKTKAE